MVTFVGATTGRPFADISYQQFCELCSHKLFLEKVWQKTFLNAIQGGGCRPHTPVSLIRATSFFEKKLGKKLLVSLLFLILKFFNLPENFYKADNKEIRKVSCI